MRFQFGMNSGVLFLGYHFKFIIFNLKYKMNSFQMKKNINTT